ncbi:Acylamidase [compost metagenome]
MIFETPYGHLYPDQRDALKDTVIWNLELGKNLSSTDIARAERLRSQCFSNLADFLSEYEFLVSPVSQVAPFPVDQEYISEINGTKMDTYIDWMSSCYYRSVTGHPAISVPCGFTENGLPIGIQIVGRYRKELELLRFAYMFERLTLFSKKRPLICNT